MSQEGQPAVEPGAWLDKGDLAHTRPDSWASL